jgi:hypothetical protein
VAEDSEPLAGTVESQQLVLEEERLGDNGTSAAATNEFGYRRDEMDKQDDQVAHPDIVAIRNVTRLGYLQDLCDKSGIVTDELHFGRLSNNDRARRRNARAHNLDQCWRTQTADLFIIRKRQMERPP